MNSKLKLSLFLLGFLAPISSWAQLYLFQRSIEFQIRQDGDVDVFEHWAFTVNSDQFESELAIPMPQGDGRDYKSFFSMYDSHGKMTRDSVWTEGRSRELIAGHYALLKEGDDQLMLRFGVPLKGKTDNSNLRIFTIGYTIRDKIERFENGPAFRFTYENKDPWTARETKVSFFLKNDRSLTPDNTAIWWHTSGYSSTRAEEKDGKISVVCTVADDKPVRMEGLVLMKPGQVSGAKYMEGIVRPAENMTSLTPKCATAPLEPKKENPLPHIILIAGLVATILIGIYTFKRVARQRNWLGQNDIYEMTGLDRED